MPFIIGAYVLMWLAILVYMLVITLSYKKAEKHGIIKCSDGGHVGFDLCAAVISGFVCRIKFIKKLTYQNQ